MELVFDEDAPASVQVRLPEVELRGYADRSQCLVSMSTFKNQMEWNAAVKQLGPDIETRV
ncbi:hypothetical protein E4U58_000586 [Claviceps cyperi]|nr:hypothetical protein E4U58_000586 [Claviceps cyperi]